MVSSQKRVRCAFFSGFGQLLLKVYRALLKNSSASDEPDEEVSPLGLEWSLSKCF
jgi:hypothetical protein